MDQDSAGSSRKQDIRYAGFGIRFGASLIDFIIFLPLVVLNIYNIINIKSMLIAVGIVVISTLYKPLFEYFFQATWGKMAVNLKVVDEDYERIDLTQAILRYSPWLITNIFTLMAAIIMFEDPGLQDVSSFMEYGQFAQTQSMNAYTQWIWLIILVSAFGIFFTAKKQAVHDLLAGTYCIYKDE